MDIFCGYWLIIIQLINVPEGEDLHSHHMYATQHWRPGQISQEEEGRKEVVQIGMEKAKLIIADDMIVHKVKPLRLHQKTAATDKFRKDVRHVISSQNQFQFYTLMTEY